MKANSKLHSFTWSSLEVLYRMYVGASMSVLSRINFGMNVYNRDWDVLVILDTARLDTMKQVSTQFDFIQNIDSIWSLGSTSSEWIAKTFNSEHKEAIANTVLVSANPHVQHTLFEREFPEHDKDAFFSITDWDTVQPDQFQHIDQPWKYATNEQYNHVLPHNMTERAVSLYHDQSPNRMIVHYMQPHRPHMANAYQENRELTNIEEDPFSYLKNGGDRNEVRSNHISDLEFVLRTGVQPLLRNVDADTVVITSDHGDGFGENWCYAHIAGDPRKQVRRVPWVETEANDRGELQPSLSPPDNIEDNTQDRLEALGYI